MQQCATYTSFFIRNMLPEFQRSLLLQPVGKSEEFLLKVRRLFFTFSVDDEAAVFTSTRRNFFRRRRRVDVASTTSDNTFECPQNIIAKLHQASCNFLYTLCSSASQSRHRIVRIGLCTF